MKSHLYSEVVKIIEFGPFDVHTPKGAESLKFRVEVIRRTKPRRFFARIYRRETFRIQPTFPQSGRNSTNKQSVDVEIFIVDDFLAPDELQGKSANEVLQKVQNTIEQMFRKS
jgi:hypothetical protein